MKKVNWFNVFRLVFVKGENKNANLVLLFVLILVIISSIYFK